MLCKPTQTKKDLINWKSLLQWYAFLHQSSNIIEKGVREVINRDRIWNLDIWIDSWMFYPLRQCCESLPRVRKTWSVESVCFNVTISYIKSSNIVQKRTILELSTGTGTGLEPLIYGSLVECSTNCATFEWAYPEWGRLDQLNQFASMIHFLTSVI